MKMTNPQTRFLKLSEPGRSSQCIKHRDGFYVLNKIKNGITLQCLQYFSLNTEGPISSGRLWYSRGSKQSTFARGGALKKKARLSTKIGT